MAHRALSMEYCNTALWHQTSMVAPQQAQYPQHYNNAYFFGANTRVNFPVDPAVIPTYQQDRATAMLPAPNASPANTGCANLAGGANGYGHGANVGYAHTAVVASGSGSNGYGHGAPMAYDQGSAPSTSAANYAYSSMETANIAQSSASNTSRQERNKAEKKRRDKLNSCIQELGHLLPMVNNAPKKLDKTSILRLAVSYLRMHCLLPATMDQNSSLPKSLINRVNWRHLLNSNIDEDLLVVTATGKIVFLTPNIENILGYTQTELMGLSLYNITCPEDHSRLRTELTPTEIENATDSIGEMEDLQVTSSEPVTNPGSSYSYTTSCGSVGWASSSSHESEDIPTRFVRLGRGFYIRLVHRNSNKSESHKLQYELVYIGGHLRVPIYPPRKTGKSKGEVSARSPNRILLVAVISRRPGQRVTELSVMEPFKNEYVTRHALDGQILYSDHRISVVAGYLSDEVNGSQAFNFMHPDDAPWVALALFQMFAQGEALGLSCYKLLAKNGEHIYLKSYGYLEYNAQTETYASLICVNSVVTKEEGERAITEMKKRFRPLIEANDIPAELCDIVQNNRASTSSSDRIDLNSVIQSLIGHIGELKANSVHEDTDKSDIPQYQFARFISKQLPPMQYQLDNIRQNLQNSPGGMSQTSPAPPSPLAQQSTPQPQERQHLLSTSSAGSPPAAPQMNQDRPSVLRIARSSKPVTVYPVESNLISSSTVNSCVTSSNANCNQRTECGDCGISSSAAGRNSAADAAKNEQRLYGGCGDCNQQLTVQPEYIKEEMYEEKDFGQLQDTFSRSAAPGNCEPGGDAGCARNSTSVGASKVQTSCDRIGVLVQRGGRCGVNGNSTSGRSSSKRPLELLEDTLSVPARKCFKEESSVTDYCQTSIDPLDVSAFVSAADDIKTYTNALESQFPDFGTLCCEGIYNIESVNELDLHQRHVKIESTLSIQKDQISDLRNGFHNMDEIPKKHYMDKVDQLENIRETHGKFLQGIKHDFQHL